MKRRNYAMAEECDIMIAYVSSPRSGSAQTVRRANELGRQVYNLYPLMENN
jgi:predicted Rossmann fold nucleotide-binding protein DprA/Smf involved in DNA uptake